MAHRAARASNPEEDRPMDTQHDLPSTAAARSFASEAEFRQQRVTAMYQRSWTAQQKVRASGASHSVFSDFARGVASPFGVQTETQSATDAALWHRERLRDMKKLPQIGDVHRYETGESRRILFVVFERNRLQ